MILVFILSMPENNAWNGKWSGGGKFYAKVENLGSSKRAVSEAGKILEGQPYDYDFGDGWTAMITVSEVDAKGAREARKASRGFCGYDWMVDSIIRHGKIQVSGADDNAEET